MIARGPGEVEIQIWDADDPQDRKAWIDSWSRWPGREVFGHPEYARLYTGPHVRALCAAASVGNSHVLYPFLLRALEAEPYCDPSLSDRTDISTPYGYGGPFRWGAAWSAEDSQAFWRGFDVWAGKAGVVSEVVRLSLFPETLLEYAGESQVLSENVVRDIRSEEELWMDFDHKVRKNVNKARAKGLTVRIDETGERLEDFLGIYLGTMERRNAGATGCFPRSFFERINAELKGQFAYFHAFVDDVVISTELVLVSADRIYSFLGGTNADWFHFRPNDLLKVEIMNWARAAGKAEFVLGGGYVAGDGIYRYKLAFAPHGSVPFSLGSRILNGEAYAHLVDMRRTLGALLREQWHPKAHYFPAYRA
jgi:hypothetical protein